MALNPETEKWFNAIVELSKQIIEKEKEKEEVKQVETEIIKQTFQPSIKLSKLSTKKYSWEIRVSGDDTNKIIEEIEDINEKLLEKFLNSKGKKTRGDDKI